MSTNRLSSGSRSVVAVAALTALLAVSGNAQIFISGSNFTVNPGGAHETPPGGQTPTDPMAEWKCGSKYYVATTGSPVGSGSRTSPWDSLQTAMASTAVNSDLAAGTPVTVHVGPGLYASAQTVALPAFGVKIQGEGPGTSTLDGSSGSSGQNTFTITTVGTLVGPCGTMPPSEIRNLEIRNSGGWGILLAPSAGALTEGGPVRVKIVGCEIHGHRIGGILVSTVAGNRSEVLIEGNTIYDNDQLAGVGPGSGIFLGAAGESSNLVRRNIVRDHDINIRCVSLGAPGAVRERILSNFVSRGTDQIVIEGGSPWIVGNTIAYAVPRNGETLVRGISYGGARTEVLTVVNNILWNPDSIPFGLYAGDELDIMGAATQVIRSNVIEDGAADPNVGVNGNIATDPSFMVPGGGDLHLSLASPVRDAGDNSFVTTPLTIDVAGTFVRADDGQDIDGDSRCLDNGATGSATVGIGADEVASARVAVATTTPGTAIDGFGNLTYGTATSVNVQITTQTRPLDFVLVMVWTGTPVPSADSYNVFNDPFGNLLVPLGAPTVAIVASGQANAAGVYTSAFNVAPISSAIDECELYVQALSQFGSLGDYTNRARIEINP